MKNIGEKKSIVYYSPEYSEGDNRMEMDQESNGSSSTEDVESPRWVAVEKLKRRRSYNTKVHANNYNDQVSRIKTEDSRLGEDIIGEIMNFDLKDGCFTIYYSRPVLPASPLRGNTTAH